MAGFPLTEPATWRIPVPMYRYRQLDPAKIVETLEQLERRISERFAGAGITAVCTELIEIARQTNERAAAIGRPDWRLRSAVGLLLAFAAYLLLSMVSHLISTTQATDELFGTLQGIDSSFNLLLLMGASVFFLVTLEDRLKRKRALDALHELRSIVHVIDMHQLTKDPSTDVSVSQPTASSPKRSLDTYELIRYLDYCSEMLSLTSKVAVLYAQSFPDAVVTEAVNDLERTATSLSQKVWQKINILYRAVDMAAPASGQSAAAVGSMNAGPAPGPQAQRTGS